MAEFAKNIARFWDSTIAGRHKIEACDLMVDAIDQLVRTHSALNSSNVRSVDALAHAKNAVANLEACHDLVKELTKERKMFGKVLSMVGDQSIPSSNGRINLQAVLREFGNGGEITKLAKNMADRVEQMALEPEANYTNLPNISNQIATLVDRSLHVFQILDPGRTRFDEIAKGCQLASEYNKKMAAREVTAAAKLN